MITMKAVVLTVLHFKHEAEGQVEEHTVVKCFFEGGSGKVTGPSLVWDDRQVPLQFQYPGEPQHAAGEAVLLTIHDEDEIGKMLEARAAREVARKAGRGAASASDLAAGGGTAAPADLDPEVTGGGQ